MTNNQLPVLYSFRRCPYAIRARMAIFKAGIQVQLHEVSLKNKPQSMLDISAKGTVPVLCVEDSVIDESLDIMLWSVKINDPDGWFSRYSELDQQNALRLIEENDHDFKLWLDKYKYADRFPEQTADYYRQQCDTFLSKLESSLHSRAFLLSSKITLADIAIFPFIRQFSMVDKKWFDQCEYQKLKIWLNSLLNLPLFIQIMDKKLNSSV